MTLSDHQYHLLHNNNNETASDAVEDDLDDSSGPLVLDDADATERDHAIAKNNENHQYNFEHQFFLSASYQNYVTTRQSADPYVYLATLAFCIVTTVLLCCMVVCKRCRQNKNCKKKQEETTMTTTTTEIPTGSPKRSPRSNMARLVVSPAKTVSSIDSSSSPPSSPRLRREASAEEEGDVVEAEGFEVVLKTPTRWSRHRGHARWRHTMQRLEIVYQNNQVVVANTSDNDEENETESDDNENENLSSHLSEAANDNTTINTGQCSGSGEVGSSTSSSCSWNAFLQVLHYDTDMKRLLHLACPFVAQALVQGCVEVLTAAVIGQRLGTRPLAAYVLVKACIQVTHQMTTGVLHESLTTLCCGVSSSRAWAWAPLSQRTKLIADYFQLSVVLGILGSLVLGGVWYVSMDKVLAWFGMDQPTIDIGTSYAVVLLLDYGFSGVNESIHALLNILQLEGHSAILIATEQIISFVAILLVTAYTNPTLQTIGLIHFLVGVAFMLLNIVIIWWNGWLVPYLESMTGCLAPRNHKAAKKLLLTSFTLSFGYIFTKGEWPFLTIIARVLGPTAVIAWSILRILWNAIEIVVDAFGDAAEVRCAYLLTTVEPNRARLTAYKTVFVGLLTAGFLSSFVFVAGDHIPLWLTNDASLQLTMQELMPLFALGILALTLSHHCWSLLGSQGRHALATATAFLCICLICIPLAYVFAKYLDFNLSGQAAAVVVGYSLSGAINAYFVFTSVWEDFRSSW